MPRTTPTVSVKRSSRRRDASATSAALQADDIAQVMQGLADINRLRIVNLLLQRDELCVCDIERVLTIPQTRVSRHLSILRHAGLVSARRRGRWMHYQLVRDAQLNFDLFSSLKNAFPTSTQFAEDIATLENASALACEISTEAE